MAIPQTFSRGKIAETPRPINVLFSGSEMLDLCFIDLCVLLCHRAWNLSTHVQCAEQDPIPHGNCN